MKKILGISAFYHDSAAALVIGGRTVSAVQEERFTRIKHTPDFPVNAIKYCLEDAGLTLDELDAIVFYDKPFLKFERLLETYYAFSPKGLLSFLKAVPVWIKEKMFLKKLIYDGLKDVGTYNKKKVKLLFTEHHLSHAASAFFVTNYTDAAILTIDGVGEWCTASIGWGKGSKIEILQEMNFPHSLGLLYSAFTYYLGFKVNSGEYKLMGLAPFGTKDSEETTKFISLIKTHLIDIKNDGSLWLNQSFFNYATGLKMVKESKWTTLFGFPPKKEEDEILPHHCNLAMAIQCITEEVVLKMAIEAKRLTGAANLCMAGGVALNCVANGKLQKTGIYDSIYIQPAAGDAGGALGAALAISQMYFNEQRVIDSAYDHMQGSYLGPDYSDKEIEGMCKKTKAKYVKYENFEVLVKEIATKINDGKVIGWFQGKMEFGPRALGNRSILGDTRNEDMQKKLNLSIKYREGFRPFAPAVLEEMVSTYFDLNASSPYMLLVAPVKAEFLAPLPHNYNDLSLWDKLYHKRSALQAITHVNGSARIQTVNEVSNPRFHQLIQEFNNLTGCGILVNTSFNVRGEPMVCTPLDAYRCFMATEMDYLVINDFVFSKTEQPDWENKEKWMRPAIKD